VRLQASFLGFLRRWVESLAWGNLGSVVPAVFPVAIVGRDYSDIERASFVASIDTTAPGASFPRMELHATDGDVEILAAWLWRDANPTEAFVDFRTGANAIAISFGSAPGTSNASLIPASSLLGPGVSSLRAPAGSLLQVPIAGTIVAKGRVCIVEQTDAATRLRGGMMWRNLGGAGT